MSDKEKIEQIMLDKHLNNTQFCAKVGIVPGTLSHILSGRTNPTLNILRNIKSVFPDINPDWLFFDDGPMYKSDDSKSSNLDAEGLDTDYINNVENEDTAASDFVQQDLFAQSLTRGASVKQSVFGQQNDVQRSHRTNTPEASAYPVNISELVQETVKQQMQRPQRKIVEVRIFFDDGTFETFGAK